MIAPEYATRMPGYISATLPSLSKTVSNTARAATDTGWFHRWSNGRDRTGKKPHDIQQIAMSRVNETRLTYRPQQHSQAQANSIDKLSSMVKSQSQHQSHQSQPCVLALPIKHSKPISKCLHAKSCDTFKSLHRPEYYPLLMLGTRKYSPCRTKKTLFIHSILESLTPPPLFSEDFASLDLKLFVILKPFSSFTSNFLKYLQYHCEIHGSGLEWKSSACLLPR